MRTGSWCGLWPTCARADWAEAELGQARLGDVRRTRRLIQVATAVAAQPSASIPRACGAWARTKAAYHLFGRKRAAGAIGVADAVRASHCQATRERLVGQSTVLAVQDTTELDLSHHPATEGLGGLGRGRRRGLLLHSTLAVTTDGVPLGLLAQQTWARDVAARGQNARRRQRPLSEKESRKWLEAVRASQQGLPAGVTLVHVGDREADVYDLFVAVQQRPDAELLIRAQADRRIDEPLGRLRAGLQAGPVAATRQVELPRADQRPARTATLALRWRAVTLRPPRHRPRAERLPEVAAWAVLVQEIDAPAGQQPIDWLLLTTVPVTSVAEAWERVRWYTYRWRIERFHLVLKSGCRIEARQFRGGESLAGWVALFSVIASRLLYLTYHARVNPELPAEHVVSPEEWRVLWAVRHPEQALPEAATVRQVMREIAGLGGFLGRRHDGEPGPITLWQGLRRFHDLLAGYGLAQQLFLQRDVGKA